MLKGLKNVIFDFINIKHCSEYREAQVLCSKNRDYYWKVRFRQFDLLSFWLSYFRASPLKIKNNLNLIVRSLI